MHTNSNYFIANSSRAYRSEIALFRHERETAEGCWPVEARAGATKLYEIVGPGDGLTVTADWDEAWARFVSTKAQAINTIPVVD